jgi:hypothetical protein
MKLRDQILKQLHVPHAGISRTRALAKKHFFGRVCQLTLRL